MEIGPFVVDLPIINGDFPLFDYYQRVGPFSFQSGSAEMRQVLQNQSRERQLLGRWRCWLSQMTTMWGPQTIAKFECNSNNYGLLYL